MTKDEAVVEVQAAEAERLAEEAVRKAQEAKAEADRAHREAIAVDVQKEEDLHRTQGKTFHIPDTKTVLTLSGFIKADVIHDFDKIESPYKFAARRIVVRGHSSDEPSSRTTVTANPSRFVIASATPTDWGKLSTFFSFDAAENTTSSDPDFRFRQGWGQLDDIFWRGSVACRSVLVELGRCHGPAGDHGFRGPQRLPADPPGPGSMGARFPKKYTLWVSVENPNYSIQNGKTKSAWPDTIASLNWHGDWGHLKPALIGRQLQGDSDDGGDDDNAFGWGVQLAGDIKVPLLAKKDNFKFQAVYGAGIGSYNNDGGIDDAVFDGNDLKAIKSFQGYGALQHWWLDSLRSNAVFGYVDVDNRNQQHSDTLERTMYFAGNLVWSPIDHMDIGGEYLWGQRDNKNGDVGTARRIQFSTKYLF